jgi:O-succinylbenzoic acid--CoA ligase
MPDRLCPLKEAARDAPHALALSSLTFAELDQIADTLSLQLHQRGIGPGDRIPLLEPPSPSAIALFFAAWRRGASICPLNLRYPPAQIKTCLERLALSIPSTPQSLFLFTSGSTATPKIAVLSLENLLASASSFSHVDLQPGDRWLLSLPLFHVGGIGIVLRCILARATIVLAPQDPAITHLSYVPAQLYRATPVYKKLKCLLLGGAPVASYPENLPVYITYGLTEMGSWVAARKNPPKIDGHFHLGAPLPGREIQIAHDGEILVRGTTLFQGYWEQGKLRAPGEWFATGDIGIDGLAILGRKDWQFISGGENIQPEEIEQHILQIPAVIEAVVLPQSDPEFGQRPVAVIRASDPSFDLPRLQRALQEHLPKYKIPIALYLVDEIPKMGLKIDRKALLRNLPLKNEGGDFIPFPR